MSIPPPSSTTVTPTQFSTILSLYPTALETVYRQNSRLKDAKKLSAALEDDKWRYEELPGIGRARGEDAGESGKGKGKGGWLEKAEVERLVGWKITHGQHRPFLPSLIRQNDVSLVKSTTQNAFSSTTTTTSHSSVNSALTALTKPLKGVGPATATLLLSVHDPESIPFFSDELYTWLVDSNTTAGEGKRLEKKELKLKYDAKEYGRLFEGWLRFREMMGEVKAVDVEKVAWVVGHWNQLSQEDMDSVGVAVEGEADDTAARRGRKDVVEISGKGGVAEKRKARTDKIGDANEWEVGEELAQSVRRERSRGDKIETALGKRSKAVQEERHLVGDGTGGRRSKRLKRT